MKVFIVHGHSESGDDYIAAFAKKPNVRQLRKLVHSWDGRDTGSCYEEPGCGGPGFDGSWISLRPTEEVELL